MGIGVLRFYGGDNRAQVLCGDRGAQVLWWG